MTPANTTFGVSPIQEIDVLWITAGLGCDGDTIAMTAATQPSLEELLLGGIPGIPKVNFHNPFLAYENGEALLILTAEFSDISELTETVFKRFITELVVLTVLIVALVVCLVLLRSRGGKTEAERAT